MPRPSISKFCLANNCGRKSKGHGLCEMHLQRYKKYGTTELPPPRPPRICMIDGCDKPYSAKGFCSTHYGAARTHSPKLPRCCAHGCDRSATYGERCAKHYRRQKKFGSDNLPLPKPTVFILETALKYEGDDCLAWPFGFANSGYGQLSYKGKVRLAHALVCELKYGLPPLGKPCAAHYCGNRACVNPRHIRFASYAENVQDMYKHGTMLCGSARPDAKLTDKDVRKIRSLGGTMTSTQIASIFGVSASHVRDILNRKRWAWLD